MKRFIISLNVDPEDKEKIVQLEQLRDRLADSIEACENAFATVNPMPENVIPKRSIMLDRLIYLREWIRAWLDLLRRKPFED